MCSFLRVIFRSENLFLEHAIKTEGLKASSEWESEFKTKRGIKRKGDWGRRSKQQQMKEYKVCIPENPYMLYSKS